MDPAILRAWIELGLVFCFYACASVLLRLRRRGTLTTRYEPPAGISPGLAGYLFERGRSERAFAAGIVSLAAKGYLRIAQGNDQFIVEKLREPESGLPEEEVSILENVCLATAYKYRFSSTDSGSIPYAHRKFRLVITASAVPQFLSSHFELWLFGVIISLAILGEALISLPSNGVRLTIGGLAYLCFWILLGGVALISAVRTWPPTLKKLAFLFPEAARRGNGLRPTTFSRCGAASRRHLDFYFCGI